MVTKKSANTTAADAAAELELVPLWDTYVADAHKDVKPWRMRLSPDEVLEVPCPTSAQMDELGAAQQSGDTLAMMTAVFGADDAPRVMDLTADLPFTVRLKLVRDVMMHYGMSLADMGESSASSS
jgi:hypothetical protein